MQSKSLNGLSGKPAASAAVRYRTLDALRGVAALFVVARHCGPWVPQFSYLGVDMFFVLSGFVLAKANDHRFESGMTGLGFMWRRVKRLYPLYALGLVLGLLSMLAPNPAHLSGSQILAAFGFEAFGLPAITVHLGAITAIDADRLMPLNTVLWSIFFEFWVANLAYGLLWRFLHGWRLLAVIAICALSLIVCEKLFFTLDVGYVWRTFPAGLARVGFSFFAGVALARLHANRPAKFKAPAWSVMLFLAAALCIPLKEHAGHMYELACVLIAFPVTIYFGAEAVEKRPMLGRLLGDASYAVYVIHRPLIYFSRWAVLGGPAAIASFVSTRFGGWLFEVIFVAIAAVLGLAVANFYDEPVRRQMTRLSKRSRPGSNLAHGGRSEPG